MNSNESILTVKDYGSIAIKLKAVMDSKGITRNHLARSVNTRFEVIDKWYSGSVEKLDLDVLARICFVLGCDVSDILEYKK